MKYSYDDFGLVSRLALRSSSMYLVWPRPMGPIRRLRNGRTCLDHRVPSLSRNRKHTEYFQNVIRANSQCVWDVSWADIVRLRDIPLCESMQRERVAIYCSVLLHCQAQGPSECGWSTNKVRDHQKTLEVRNMLGILP